MTRTGQSASFADEAAAPERWRASLKLSSELGAELGLEPGCSFYCIFSLHIAWHFLIRQKALGYNSEGKERPENRLWRLTCSPKFLHASSLKAHTHVPQTARAVGWGSHLPPGCVAILVSLLWRSFWTSATSQPILLSVSN